ncbi:MAG: AAA family ATPase [Faecalibacterium sp.]|nr:AAA family ATPase [Ruminococcus sp.]MCM1391884.1 AAA family ATPase [Ruminococcus sp.]MCM1485540.1 AAA family ATPase [Faecalibacterium sp.]
MSYIFKTSDVFDFANVVNSQTKEKGGELFFRFCPYCGGGKAKDKDTFSINLESGAFKCFRASCGKQGHFVELARDFGFTLDYENEKKQYRRLPQRKPVPTYYAIEFMKSRGIGRQTTERYRLTTQKDNPKVLVFPFFDENDVLVSVKYRKTDFDKTRDKSKEWFEKDTKPILFGMAQCKGFSRLIITEGQLDSLSVADCGFNNAVSVPTGALGFRWLTACWDWIIKFKEVIVFGDLENGRMSLIDELQKRLPQKVKAVRHEDYLGEKDANDIYRKYGKSAIEKCIKNAEVQKIKNVKQLCEVEKVDLDTLPKIKTNIKELDRLIGGLIYGQVVLLSGKRGNGKSTFMSQLVCEALEQGESAFIYSGELADYHFKRWLDYQLAGANNIITEINDYGDEAYYLDDAIVDKISTWYKDRAYIYDNNYLPDDGEEYESLINTVENVIKQYGTKLICIDNLMTAMDTVTEQNNLYLAQSNFVGRLKKIAIKHNVVIILVAHPRKSNQSFSNDDVSGSGDITNKVDVVMSYQRDEKDETYNGRLSITKNRLNGKCVSGDDAIGLIYSEKTKRITSPSSGVRHYGWEMQNVNTDGEELLF